MESWNSATPAGYIWVLQVPSWKRTQGSELYTSGVADDGKSSTPPLFRGVCMVVNSQEWSLSAPVCWEYGAQRREPWWTACSWRWTQRRSLTIPAAPWRTLIFKHTNTKTAWGTENDVHAEKTVAETLMHLISKPSALRLHQEYNCFVCSCTDLGSLRDRCPHLFLQSPWMSGRKYRYYFRCVCHYVFKKHKVCVWIKCPTFFKVFTATVSTKLVVEMSKIMLCVLTLQDDSFLPWWCDTLEMLSWIPVSESESDIVCVSCWYAQFMWLLLGSVIELSFRLNTTWFPCFCGSSSFISFVPLGRLQMAFSWQKEFFLVQNQ